MIEVDAVVSGIALDTDGLMSLQFNLDGLSLITDGFLASCDAIWTSSETPIKTTWLDTNDLNPTLETCLGD